MTILHDAYTALLSGLTTYHPDYPDEIIWEYEGYKVCIKPIDLERNVCRLRIPDESTGWFMNDKLHREDGPAIEHVNGTKMWWLNGRAYSKEDYEKEIQKTGDNGV
jgi:hypothetical protein